MGLPRLIVIHERTRFSRDRISRGEGAGCLTQLTFFGTYPLPRAVRELKCNQYTCRVLISRIIVVVVGTDKETAKECAYDVHHPVPIRPYPQSKFPSQTKTKGHKK